MYKQLLKLILFVFLELLFLHQLQLTTLLKHYVFFCLSIQLILYILDLCKQILHFLLISLHLLILCLQPFVQFFNFNTQSLVLPTHSLHFRVFGFKRVITIQG